MLGPCLSAAGPHSYIIQCLVRFQVQIKFVRKVDRKQTILFDCLSVEHKSMAKKALFVKILRPLSSSEFLSRNKETKETMPLYNLYKKYYVLRTH